MGLRSGLLTGQDLGLWTKLGNSFGFAENGPDNGIYASRYLWRSARNWTISRSISTHLSRDFLPLMIRTLDWGMPRTVRARKRRSAILALPSVGGAWMRTKHRPSSRKRRRFCFAPGCTRSCKTHPVWPLCRAVKSRIVAFKVVHQA